ncbi:MAG: endonuclease V [Chlorobi bacterium]|nr:endonuclease V [Chlorobiota bacterium]
MGSPREAIRLQKELVGSIELKPLEKPVRFIAGFDCAFIKREEGEFIVAGGVVWDSLTNKIVSQTTVVEKVQFPYIPGLLAFREMPAITKLSLHLEKPDLIMVDGHGIAHPRRAGIAVHIGIWAGIPTIGVAKKKLVGTYEMPCEEKGCQTFLYDRSEKIGIVLRSRTGVKPIFVSPGNLINLSQAIDVTLKSCLKYRLPEPTRLAHHLVSLKRKEINV